MDAPFRDRFDAGRQLAAALADLRGDGELLVLALPRGGVPVAYEVARALGAPLDVLLVRKLGVPGHEELAMGAIASGGVRIVNREVVEALGIAPETLQESARREGAELQRRDRAYRGDRPHPDLRGRTVILIDDGLATGSTMRAAIAAVRTQDPRRVIVAVPTAAPATCEEFRHVADDCICVITPEPFRAVGLWYEDFSQTTDDEVRDLLARADREAGPS
jgi:predicted phosphoribosyltransferase